MKRKVETGSAAANRPPENDLLCLLALVEPTLRWQAFPRPEDLTADMEGRLAHARSVTYELRIRRAEGESPANSWSQVVRGNTVKNIKKFQRVETSRSRESPPRILLLRPGRSDVSDTVRRLSEAV